MAVALLRFPCLALRYALCSVRRSVTLSISFIRTPQIITPRVPGALYFDCTSPRPIATPGASATELSPHIYPTGDGTARLVMVHRFQPQLTQSRFNHQSARKEFELEALFALALPLLFTLRACRRQERKEANEGSCTTHYHSRLGTPGECHVLDIEKQTYSMFGGVLG